MTAIINQQQEIWLPYFNQRSPAYSIFSWLPHSMIASCAWPTLDDYNHLLHFKPLIKNANDKSIRFVEQAIKTNNFAEGYEPRIFLQGEVQTRTTNWHDFFNMLIWCTFPKIKSLLNELQFQELEKRAGECKNRSALENFLTLLDENGVIIVSSDDELLHLIRTMQWKELFWHQRNRLKQKLRCYVVGHSLHEKLLQPYIGMVGHALLFNVHDAFLTISLPEQITQLQHFFSKEDLNQATSRNLYPVPVLGFPNWHPATDNEFFYHNEKYFRRKTAGLCHLEQKSVISSEGIVLVK